MARKVARSKWPVFLAKAEEFLRAGKPSLANREWNAAVSSAVHAGILACDVVTVGLSGVRNASAHEEIVRILAAALINDSRESATQTRRIERLLGAKNIAEYEDRALHESDAQSALLDAERLVEFARSISKRF